MNDETRSGFKILAGYDGPRTAKEALKLAVFHARHFKARVYVAWSLIGGHEDSLEKIETARDGLQQAESLFRDEGIPYETHLLVRGLSAGEDLVQFADENHVDEIVVGVRKRSQVSKLLFGSTSRFVILNAPCPVVTVK